jgi:hypothetical protein
MFTTQVNDLSCFGEGAYIVSWLEKPANRELENSTLIDFY